MNENEQQAPEAIAIIGMSGRFPGAASTDEFWRMLLEGVDGVEKFDPAMLEYTCANPEDVQAGRRFVCARGTLPDVDKFDAPFFGIYPKEAELMDPQHRFFLECAWESLESAGYDPGVFPGLIGVYAGVSLNTYLLWQLGRGRLLAGNYQVGEYQTMLGNDKDFMPVRVSYKLNLRGPSMGVQCACSTSLVAICQAATSLLTYQCDMALAGASSITFPQRRDYPFEPDAMVSADGECRAFDAGANGTIFGHGCAVILMKRLREAVADGDSILGVIRGWAVNNDGSEKVGFAAPSVKAQADVIAMAQAAAGISPDEVSYIEAHGTGTPMGDPIEVAGLTQAFRAGGTKRNGYCALGTGKTHIGHLDVAAGVAGVIKTLLQFQHERIPALRNYRAPNPRIDFANSPFVPVAETRPWPRGASPRLAGVSAFGVGGTNAHVVLEEPPLPAPPEPGHARELLVLSARTPDALDRMTVRLAEHLEANPNLALADVAHTLAFGRKRMTCRRAVVAASVQEAAQRLRAALGGKAGSQPAHARAPAVAFLFPGQGAQVVGMGHSLYQNEPVFRACVDECAEALRAPLGVDIRETLYPTTAQRAEAEQRIQETWLTQPVIFTVELALARLWQARGIHPALVVGHSVGEYVAAVLAGVFTVPDALRLLASRARRMMALPAGSMLAVRVSAEELAPSLPDGVSVAAINSPKGCTVSGPTPAIQALQQQLEARGVMARLLPTSHAFHSSMMDPMLGPFAQEAATVPHQAPAVPWISTCTGHEISAAELADGAYWARQVRQPVLFGQALEKAFALPGVVLLEVGPGQALAQFARQHPARPAAVEVVASMPGVEGSDLGEESFAQATAALWCAGWEPDWTAWFAGHRRRRLPLPTYPFERQRYWLEAPVVGEVAALPAAGQEAEPVARESAGGSASPASAQDATLTEVVDVLQDLSGMDRDALDPQRSFLDLGFDSLFLTQVSLALQKKYLLKLTLRQMLDDLSSPAAIAHYIAAHRPAPAGPPSAPPPGDAAAEKVSLAQAGPFGPEVTPASAPVIARHGPFAPINKSAGDALSPRQQQHLDALIERYNAKTRRSKEHTQQHRDHFSDPRAVSGFRVTWKELTYPIVSVRSAGSKIWDLDGNEFLDVTMGFGTYLFGHNPEFIRRAIEKQLATGIEIGPQNALAGEIAQTMCRLSGMDRVTFCTTGSEAVMGAVRAARTVTGRNKVVYFSGDYHGIHEEVLAKGQWAQGKSRTLPIAPGIPNELVSQVHVLTYGDPASLEWIRANAASLAAVLVEPVQSRKPELQPREFILALRELTREKDIALIFDEIVTGFRLHLRGAQAWYGIQADITTYGKIVGGGLPIGVIAGRRPYLDAFDGGTWRYGDDSVPEAGVTFFAGTFVRHPLSMAAAKAVLDHLIERGPALQEHLSARTETLVAALNELFFSEGVDLQVNRCASLWYFSHGESFKYYSLMFHFLRDQGLHIWEGRPCFMSTAHTEEDLARLMAAFRQALSAMREGGFLPEKKTTVPTQGPFHLTDAQQEIWLTSRLDEKAYPAFNESCALTFRGPLQRAAMESALQQLVQRHEALRTTVEEAGDKQRVQATARASLVYEDLGSLEAAARDARYHTVVHEEVQRPFDLKQAPLLRARLVRLGEDHHVLLLTAHHIICDGWSYDVMTRDFSALYSMAVRGERDQRPLPTQFRDYARQMAVYRQEPRYELDLGYWTKLLAAPPEALQLPSSRPRPAVRSFEGAMEVTRVDDALLASIKELGAQQRCTLFSTLMALYAVLLHRLTGQQDLVIGIPAAGQQLMEGQDLVGHCANLLPLRLRVSPDQPFSALLASAQRAMLDAYEHQGITFGTVLKALQLPRDVSRPPLIQVTFNVDPAMHGLNFAGLETEIVINPRTAYQFEHSLNIVAYSDRLRIECNYNTELFDQPTVLRWLQHYQEIARAVARKPDLMVGEIPLMTAEEQRRMVLEWNRTAAPYPACCIHELFEQEAGSHPDRIALSMAGRTLQYGELNAQANRLAHHLRAMGVGPDQPVGICTERSLEMVVGLLGILKAGGAYLPLDPAHPAERLKLQVADAGMRVAVGLTKYDALLAGLGVQRVLLDQADADWRARDGQRPPALQHVASQLAYILYTSGSTGQPKGVQIEHRSVMRLVRGSAFMTWSPADCMLQHSPLAFDASTLEVWGPLLNGSRLAILPPGPFSFETLASTLEQEKVTSLWLTGSVFHRMVDEHPAGLAPVKQLLAGGEVLSGARIERLLKLRPDLTITNGYGPTESTTFAATETFSAGDVVDEPPPLGRPIANTQVYVLDERMRPVPVGVAGELCIGGDGLARGYLKRPELTAQAFIKNPLPGTPGDRLYCTGDRARWRPDGRLDFLGRLDEQVKIRGFRIEPGEIEAVLSTYPGLQSCAVIVRNDATGEKQLAAYVAMMPGQPTPAVESLRAHLRTTMPDFMLPGVFSIHPSLPLTASGKVDRRALPDLAAGGALAAAEIVEPRTEMEVAVARVWMQTLGLNKVGMQDDFFALGGHSLAALKLITRLREAGYGLEVADLFRHSTLSGMLKVLTPLASEAGRLASDDYVVRLKEGRPGQPTLCLLPSDFGDLLIYANLLPLLPPDQPCIGMQCPRMYENDEGITSMPALASFFIRRLQAVQPQGPYMLAGYCFGGFVALEMAKQLRAAGHAVSMLGLIDARPYRPVVERGDYLLMLMQGAIHARPSDWWRYLSARWAMRRETKLIDSMARLHPDQLGRRELNRWILETRVMHQYRSEGYDGPITFFYPEESQYQLYGDPSCGWLYQARRVYLHKVPGSHLNMMKEPHVRKLAEKLMYCIRQATETAS